MSNHGWFLSCAGVKVPRLIYGTAWKKEHTKQLVEEAFYAGFRGFDTACQPRHYQESLVGKALAALGRQGVGRSEYYLQTKFTPLSGQDLATVPYDPQADLADQVAQSFIQSQFNLQTDYLDGWLLHALLPDFSDTLRVWRAMERIVGEGGARQLGISNCYDLKILEALYREAKVKPAVVQNRFYQQAGYDHQIRAWCTRHDIIYQGFRTLTANPHILQNETLVSVAAAHHKTPEQIMFLYLSQHSVVPLTGTRSLQHMKQDLACLDDELMPPEVDALDSLFSQVA